MTFSEKEEVITAALELWKSILPPGKAFYGRGNDGPKLIMTDDSAAERNSLQSCFPNAILLLCIFHILNAVWRYVWDSHHNVKSHHKGEIYFLFHKLLYASSLEEFEAIYDDILKDETVQLYGLVVNHFKDLKLRAKEWALCYRTELLTRDTDTNNICEAVMLIIKNLILFRTKAFNAVQLLDFLITRLDSYYKRKLAFFLSNMKKRAKHSIGAPTIDSARLIAHSSCGS